MDKRGGRHGNLARQLSIYGRGNERPTTFSPAPFPLNPLSVYVPFNVQTIGAVVVVTFANQDAAKLTMFRDVGTGTSAFQTQLN
jgi:hypothetical protein